MRFAVISVLIAAVVSSAGGTPSGGMTWKGVEDGLELLSFSLSGEERNLVNPGKRLGHILLKWTAQGEASSLDTAKDFGEVKKRPRKNRS